MVTQVKLLGIINAGFDVTDQLPIRLLHSPNTGEKWEYNETAHQLFISFQKAYDSVRREVLYSNLTEFGVPMKLVRLIKMCLNELYSKVRVGKHLSGCFPIQNDLNLIQEEIKRRLDSGNACYH
jgi:hypothetical protein